MECAENVDSNKKTRGINCYASSRRTIFSEVYNS